MVLMVQQCIFVVETYTRLGSWKQCAELFTTMFAVDGVATKAPAKSVMQKLVAKWRETGSVLNRPKVHPKTVCTEAKVGEAAQLIIRSLRKSSRRLEEQLQVCQSTAMRILKQDLNLHAFKVTVMHMLRDVDKSARVLFCEWFLSNIAPEVLQDGYLFISDEAGLHLSGYINTQNMRYWSADNPHVFMAVPLHAQKLGVWCAVSSHHIIPVFFHETVNAARYISNIFNVFVAQLTEDERRNAYFQQDGATAHTAHATITRIESVFPPDRVISRGTNQPWPPHSPDLSPCDFFLWEL